MERKEMSRSRSARIPIYPNWTIPEDEYQEAAKALALVRHNATACVVRLRRQSPVPQFLRREACSPPAGSKALEDEDAAWTAAMHKVRRGMQQGGSIPAQQPVIRVFCMVYTYAARHDIVAAIAATWGRECDGFMAASNSTNASIGAVKLPHPGPEAYGLMWSKVNFMWKYVKQVSVDFSMIPHDCL